MSQKIKSHKYVCVQTGETGEKRNCTGTVNALFMTKKI